MQTWRIRHPVPASRGPARAGTLASAVLAALLATLTPSAAQPTLAKTGSGFPARPVRILVNTSPGGLLDFTARKFAEQATRISGTPFVVINKPGAGGVVAFEELLRSQPDGYTLLAVTRSNLPKLIASGRGDLLERVDWAAKLLDDPQCVIVNLQSPTPDWAAVVQQALQMQGRQLWLGPDIGGLDHVSAMKIMRAAGIEARWIPYESGGQAIAALLGGLGATYTGNPSETRGRPDLAVAAVCAPQRLPQFPDVPTFAELGVEGVAEESMWRGFACHPALPPDIRAWFDELFAEVTATPAWREEWEKDGLEVGFEREREFHALVAREIREFAGFLATLGILAGPGRNNSVVSPLLTRSVVAGSLLAFLGTVLLVGRHTTAAWRWSASQWVALGGFGLVAVLAWEVAGLPPGNEFDPVGPAGIPLLWMLLLLPCLAVVAWQDRPVRGAQPRQQPAALGLAFAAVLILLVGLMPVLGYYLAAAIALPSALYLLGWRRPLAAAGIAALWLLFVYFGFQVLLHVDLPVLPRF